MNLFRGNDQARVNIVAKLTKPIYFTDETIQLEVEIDNSQGEDAIEGITATLR